MDTTCGERIAVDPLFGVGVPPRQEVVFRDGSTLWLHRVMKDGSPSLMKRAIGTPAGIVVDLGDLVHELRADLPSASTPDVPGMVHWHLRLAFSGAQAVLDHVHGGAAA